MQKITPFLWFDDNAEEAVQFYVSVFPNSKISNVKRYGAAGPGPQGTVMGLTFELEGQAFDALNGGPHFKFTPAISLFVNCETQQEVDNLWDKLAAGGKPQKCGWVTDKFGLTWQIIPRALGRFLDDPDPSKTARVMQAMMKMVKIDIAALQRAHDGQPERPIEPEPEPAAPEAEATASQAEDGQEPAAAARAAEQPEPRPAP